MHLLKNWKLFIESVHTTFMCRSAATFGRSMHVALLCHSLHHTADRLRYIRLELQCKDLPREGLACDQMFVLCEEPYLLLERSGLGHDVRGTVKDLADRT